MRTQRLSGSASVFLLSLALGGTGCVKKMLLDGQIESTRKASAAIDTIGDYEAANTIAFAGLAQFEGMHRLAPENEDALFLLTKGWAGTGFAFIEDQMEQTEDSEGADGPMAEYHRARARAAYDRSIQYGIELLEKKNEGFEAARKNDDNMKVWLSGFDADDVPNLFWTGYAWMLKTNVAKEDPAVVGDLYVGVAMINRVVELDETYLFGSAHTALGSYHARTAMAELDESKKHFDRAIELSKGGMLMAKFQLAAKYYCMKSDRAGYEKTLQEIIAAGDVMPEQRLSNTVAKRKARRYLTAPRLSNCGF